MVPLVQRALPARSSRLTRPAESWPPERRWV